MAAKIVCRLNKLRNRAIGAALTLAAATAPVWAAMDLNATLQASSTGEEYVQNVSKSKEAADLERAIKNVDRAVTKFGQASDTPPVWLEDLLRQGLAHSNQAVVCAAAEQTGLQHVTSLAGELDALFTAYEDDKGSVGTHVRFAALRALGAVGGGRTADAVAAPIAEKKIDESAMQALNDMRLMGLCRYRDIVTAYKQHLESKLAAASPENQDEELETAVQLRGIVNLLESELAAGMCRN